MNLDGQKKRYGIPAAGWVLGLAGTAADVVSQTDLRPCLPDFYENSAGNFAITFLVTIALGALAERKDRKLEKTNGIGFWRAMSLAFVSGMQVGVEGQFIKNAQLLSENLPDMAVGFASIVIGSIVLESLLDRFGKKN